MGDNYVGGGVFRENYLWTKLLKYVFILPTLHYLSQVNFFNLFATERLISATENLHFGPIPQTAERIRTLHMDWGIARVTYSPEHV